MRALVTGANGFLGSHLVDHLTAEGWDVRGLVRRTSDTRWLPRDLELVYGDAAAPGSLAPAVRDADVVFHLAGVTRAGSEAAYLEVNAEGTRNLVRAARDANVNRFVLVSSLAAGGSSTTARPRTEDDPDHPAGAYGRSKKAGEQELEANAGDMAWTVLRPCAIYGPREKDFLILARFAAGGWVIRFTGPPQRVSVIHVDDAVRALVAASRAEAAAGRTYYVAHPEAATWAQVGRRMAAAAGRRPRNLPVPRGILAVASRLTGAATLIGKKNPLPPDRVRDLLAEAWTCDPGRARTEIGFAASVSLDEGMSDLMNWYAKEGWLG
jgi:nucleoside-diphosphate-sugar epimerase